MLFLSYAYRFLSNFVFLAAVYYSLNLTRLRGGSTQLQIAMQLKVSASAISQASRQSGWQAFSEAEEGFRAALRARARRKPK